MGSLAVVRNQTVGAARTNRGGRGYGRALPDPERPVPRGARTPGAKGGRSGVGKYAWVGYGLAGQSFHAPLIWPTLREGLDYFMGREVYRETLEKHGLQPPPGYGPAGPRQRRVLRQLLHGHAGAHGRERRRADGGGRGELTGIRSMDS